MSETSHTDAEAEWYRKTNAADAAYDGAFKDLQSATEWKEKEAGVWSIDFREVERTAAAFLRECENIRAAYSTNTQPPSAAQ